MAYGIVHQFPGATKEQYEASIGAVHPSDGGLPEGQTFHAAGPSADGWVVVAIHGSQESWERFRDGVLMPRMSEGIEGGFTVPPQETPSPFATSRQARNAKRLGRHRAPGPRSGDIAEHLPW